MQKSNSLIDNSIKEKIEKKANEDRLSLLANSIFNADVKRYLPLTVLREYYIHEAIVILIISGFIVFIYIVSFTMIQDINQLLFIEKFIYGKLISTSTEIIEVKCFISSCNNMTVLNYSELKSYSEIGNIIKGLKNFKEIDNYYNDRYLLDACYAVMDKYLEEEKYNKCLNDSIIASANNTDNLMKLIHNIIDNIYKQDDMDKFTYGYLNVSESDLAIIQKYRIKLFNETNFKNVEYIFYNYIFLVGDTFQEAIISNLSSYLKYKKKIIIILIFSLALIIIIYGLVFMSFYIPRLIHFLGVSRSVMKIIPTSIIMITPELESWIENKYYDLSIC